AYIFGRRSQLGFWHEAPAVNTAALRELSSGKAPASYYMTFRDKADYAGPFDEAGVPLLEYRGNIGRQHNPIAIAQYALAWMNRQIEGGGEACERRWRPSLEWLTRNLEENASGVPVWLHRFDWPYRQTLKAPWYSGLAQGQGVSALLRGWRLGADRRYRDAAERAFLSLQRQIGEGGVLFTDEAGDPWIEEYIVEPPSHILNGFLWALWGVWDMARIGGSEAAAALFRECTRTVARNVGRYDTGYWSLYELSALRLPMLASPFYHSLHIVQLEATTRMAPGLGFDTTAGRWRDYARSRVNRSRALALKGLFKVLYY
ncbi:MAG: D-glucuronyl C5-epimerase family protein, partial [Candidatus Binatia bacterium]